ncbi:hypothetical protein SAMN04488072_102192 [Lentibacillus halodurans]|uniref:WYL domain-containing protein n=1 Tax=Lentibacillus halodurans TaxID=237679 RepID=A0A1I0W473_9BACI|nr:hypothetical protein [Lentibacillus halodurans]SFA83354.1 hypothetical protein SAMN04488072_102192 [Lentibacillus halodurans]
MNHLLARAAQTGQKLEMIYLDADHHTSYRIIRILGFNADKITAYCFTREQIRTFKKDSILSIGPIWKRRLGA